MLISNTNEANLLSCEIQRTDLGWFHFIKLFDPVRISINIFKPFQGIANPVAFKNL